MAHDKNVYILGAGASVGSGAPVLKDFLKRARSLLDQPEPILSKDELRAFQNVFGFRSKMTRALRYIKSILSHFLVD